MSRRPSFTARRRRKLTAEVRVDRLETRQTITEPISVVGLAAGSLGGLARLGLVQVHGGEVAPAIDRSRAIPTAGAGPARKWHPAMAEILPFTAAPAARPASGGSSVQITTAAPSTIAKTDVDIPPASVADASAAHGLSVPRKPAGRSGGGAAMVPRGGSGAGSQAAVSAMIRGQSPLPAPPSRPKPPATIPGVLGGSPAPSGTSGPAATVITRNAAAQRLQADPAPTSSTAAGTSIAPGGASGSVPSSMPIGPTTIHENASSLPSLGGGGQESLSFPYFPLYTLDQNDGVVLFDGQSQLASTFGTTDLYAQVKGASVSSYSWTLSGGYTSSYSGTSTDHLQIQWEWMNSSGSDQTETVTSTVIDSNSHQESQTYHFVIPASGIVSMPSSSSWPVTIPPNLVAPGAPTIASQNASVDATSGSLDTAINLPAYNPNIPALALTYNSLTANPKSIVVVHHTLDGSQSVPSKVDATLTFNGSAGTTWYYDTSSLVPGDVQQMALQADATALTR